MKSADISRIVKLPYNWDKLNSKSFFISGGTGLLGCAIIEVLRYLNTKFDAGIKVYSLSRRGGESDDTVTHIQGDVVNPIDISDAVDYVLHLASNTHPAQYKSDPVGTITTNLLGANNLLKLAADKKAERFLLASSVEIYGQGTESPMAEEYCGYINCNNARSGYNEAKRTCEALCQSYRQQYGVDCVIARLSRLIGVDKKKDTKAMAQFMANAVEGQDIVLKSKGLQRFSYCYIPDAVSGIFCLLLNGQDGEAYNISADDEGFTLGEYAEYIASLAGRHVVYNIEKDESVSKAEFALLDIGKIKALGWNPEYTVKDALSDIYNAYKMKKTALE